MFSPEGNRVKARESATEATIGASLGILGYFVLSTTEYYLVLLCAGWENRTPDTSLENWSYTI